MDWANDFFNVALKFFPGGVVGFSFQRAFLLGPLISWGFFAFVFFVRPPGSWAFYWANYNRRARQIAELAERVAPLEAEANSIKKHILLLNELRSASLSTPGVPAVALPPAPGVVPLAMPPMPTAAVAPAPTGVIGSLPLPPMQLVNR